jgi:pimeloyl-ACP methyl ester carboxylesterase
MDKPVALDGIKNLIVGTDRIIQNVYFSGKEEDTPVIFLHGNFSAALYFEELMLALPAGFRGIAPDLRGYGWTEDKLIDSTRGYRDWCDDLAALMAVLKINQAHLVAWSMSAGIVYRFIADHPERVLSATLICPVSPFGFGGTKGVDGIPYFDDHAGSGGGVVNADFVKRIVDEDRSSDDPNSPRNVMNSFYYAAPFRAAREEDFLTASLMEKTGPEKYPGDFTLSPNWPTLAPGVLGPVNCWSMKYIQGDALDFVAAQPKPPVLWVRGNHDMIVSDTSMFDIAYLGKLGYLPGWPGDEIAPPQPMIQQTRHVLDQYVRAGGSYEEHLIMNTAHSPHIEKPEEFNSIFHPFLLKA